MNSNLNDLLSNQRFNVIQKQIKSKTHLKRSDIQQVTTDYDHKPYTKLYRQQHLHNDSKIFNRQSGYMVVNNEDYKLRLNRDPPATCCNICDTNVKPYTHHSVYTHDDNQRNCHRHHHRYNGKIIHNHGKVKPHFHHSHRHHNHQCHEDSYIGDKHAHTQGNNYHTHDLKTCESKECRAKNYSWYPTLIEKSQMPNGSSLIFYTDRDD